jgi:hypothetical protein
MQDSLEQQLIYERKYRDNPNVQFAMFHWTQSQGTGWARLQSQSFFNNERYILTIDAHTRFTKNWDVNLIRQLNVASKWSTKPLLSYYPASYVPGEEMKENASPSIQEVLVTRYLYFFLRFFYRTLI